MACAARGLPSRPSRRLAWGDVRKQVARASTAWRMTAHGRHYGLGVWGVAYSATRGL